LPNIKTFREENSKTSFHLTYKNISFEPQRIEQYADIKFKVKYNQIIKKIRQVQTAYKVRLNSN
jgi:hypothetical protein